MDATLRWLGLKTPVSSMSIWLDHTSRQFVYIGLNLRAHREAEVIMKCPVCGGAELVRGTRDMPLAYKGQTIQIICGDG